MFSPGLKRSKLSSQKERNVGANLRAPDSPSTPLTENNKPAHQASIPDRPSTGTPAPWAPRLSVLARIPPANKNDKGDGVDPIKPVFVGEFPQVVHDEQTSFLQRRVPADFCISGGMDKGTCLSWIIYGNKIFIWSYLSFTAPKKCVILELPSDVLGNADLGRNSYLRNNWLLSVVNWDSTLKVTNRAAHHCYSAGIVLCNQKTRAVLYWSDIFADVGSAPVTICSSSDELLVTSSRIDSNATPNRHATNFTGSSSFNSLIASAIPGTQNACVALACCSSGELWQFYCSPNGIQVNKVHQNIQSLSSQGTGVGQLVGSKGYPRSMIWRLPYFSVSDSNRQFFLLTDHEIHCFNIKLFPDLEVSKLWSQEIVGNDGDLGIKKDLAGQKRIWPLDLQVDDHGKVITVLVATFCKDRVSSSSYTQYSLLTMQYMSEVNMSSDLHERVLEKKAPIQVIIPKARVEDEDFLFSMRLRVGGKPAGSTIILSGEGTATVSHYHRNSTRLYQFDLPHDAGKVLDASVLPATDDGEDGAWVVLTEKAGIWAIPEKAVVLGGVEPPERSLSRKGSSNEGSAQEERRNLMFANNIAPRRASSDAWDAGGRQATGLTGITRRTAQDEESEALLTSVYIVVAYFWTVFQDLTSVFQVALAGIYGIIRVFGLGYGLSHESMGPRCGFSYFVFKQLYGKKQYSKLLRLGEEFQEELSIFLNHYQDLLWLHEVFLHRFSAASETLHVVAISQDEGSISITEEEIDSDHSNPVPTLTDRRRLLNLSKIAAFAGKDADCQIKAKRIEADLKILRLQEEIMEVLPMDDTNQHVDKKLLHPEELIELCLESGSKELPLQVFDVFAWTSSSFRKSHRNLLEECWKKAADQDPWSELYQASVSEGWSDEETLQQLSRTILFKASNRCYGPKAETIEDGFGEVLPLRQENVEVAGLKDARSSVEAILMQHRDFPYAGCVQGDDVKLEESLSPMYYDIVPTKNVDKTNLEDHQCPVPYSDPSA
ncbi:hypothetical protein GOBAR_AA36683 [Gossypium barbadense]|uniref:Nucleoporin Nup133/Nup155-like N-terminal domain-containing protein n=1 Tax=Gossypium barbadense TaxID=3634 RepID=A0A2P5VYW6_GOSBA|nr:hypothetical protein GOBAR_AA36683 [Gossypium barbadense]